MGRQDFRSRDIRGFLSRVSVLDEGRHGVIELEQGLHVYGQAGLPVVSEGIQHQPGEGVVALQHVPKK
jgi:hypothetical protein